MTASRFGNRKTLAFVAKLALLAGCVLLAWWLIRRFWPQIHQLNPAALRVYLRQFGHGAMAVFVLAYALNTISILPPIGMLSLAAGLAFGPLRGAACLLLGAVTGSSCTFFIARYAGRSFVEKMLKGKLKKLDQTLKQRGFITVLVCRLIPLVPYEVLNYGCGLLEVRFRDYFWATLLGSIPWAFISAYFGSRLGEVHSYHELFSPGFIIVAAAAFVAIALPVAIYALARKRRVSPLPEKEV
ncbi:MAG TPA: TVP38/TMEM64 family protein [Candidatus Omnitrophota bacterium]|nr:TVP38/TMEM64 family protein [Candidatus Omnitrophota bacterium]HRZ14125.1 TVP38/TMEM64 family protein [Candidatus Omnitrophota bacterium]